jgi:hypothetical protein
MPSLNSLNNAFLIGFYLGIITLSWVGTVGGPLIILWLLIRSALRGIAFVFKGSAHKSATRLTHKGTFAHVPDYTTAPMWHARVVRKRATTTTQPGSPAR